MRVEVNFDIPGCMEKVNSALSLYANTCGKKAEAYAKTNRPWQDRTGNARNSIQGGSIQEDKSVKVYVSGNVDYFVYLELAHQKRFAILNPTIEKHATEFVEGYRSIFRRDFR